MTFEGAITYVTIDQKGNDKSVKDSFIFKEAELFGEVESRLYEEFGELTNFEVVAIKKSKVKEIANSRASDDDLIWEATVQDVFHADNGSEKELKYKILLFSKTFDSAKAFITEYLKQGFDMSLVSLKLTKFKDVI